MNKYMFTLLVAGVALVFASLLATDVEAGAMGAKAVAQMTPAQKDSALKAIVPVPNPTNVREENVTFLNAPQGAQVRIYTIGGTYVRTYVHDEAEQQKTPYPVWDLTSDTNQKVATGMYVYVLTCPLGTKVGKLIVVR